MDISKLSSMEIIPDIVESLQHLKRNPPSNLSGREKQVYELYFDNRLSMSGVAYELKISKSSVQTYVKRIKEKEVTNHE